MPRRYEGGVRQRRREDGFELARADDFELGQERLGLLLGRATRPTVRYVQHVSRSRISYVAREYWFELLIAAMGIACMIELVWRDYPGAPAAL